MDKRKTLTRDEALELVRRYKAVIRPRFDVEPRVLMFGSYSKGNANARRKGRYKAVPVNALHVGCNIVSDSLPIRIKQELIDAADDTFQSVTAIRSPFRPVNSGEHVVHAGCKVASQLCPVKVELFLSRIP